MATKRITTTEKKTSAPKRVRAVKAGETADVVAFPHVDHAQIAQRAYELFIARGHQHGHDMEDWLTAERELTR